MEGKKIFFPPLKHTGMKSCPTGISRGFFFCVFVDNVRLRYTGVDTGVV